MAPANLHHARSSIYNKRAGVSTTPGHVDWRHEATRGELVLESWSQGLVVGALLIMAVITVANMRSGVLLHKLILAELFLAMSHGTFCFMEFQGYGWYLSTTAALLYLSWIIHNIVTFMKIRPFLKSPGGFFSPKFSTWTKRIYIVTLVMVVPIIVFQISDNFRYFNNRGGWYAKVRPYEPLLRDPWWVFCCLVLFDVIRRCYGTGVIELVRHAPRFGILLASICVSLVFTAMDIAASVRPVPSGSTGINPWWKLSLVFKCLTDTIMLDDFKTELKRLGIKRIAKAEKKRNSIALIVDRDPAHLEDSEDESEGSGSNEKRHASHDWYGRGRRDTVASTSPTSTSAQNINAHNKHASRSRSGEPTSEQLEYGTALAVVASHMANSQHEHEDSASTVSPHNDGLQSNTTGQQREEVHGHKTRIARLPSLKQWKFEPIKSTKKSNRRSDDTDLEAQASESDGDQIDPTAKRTPGQGGVRESVSQLAGNRFSRSEKHSENGSGPADITAGTERRRRFRKSIGAVSP